MGCWPLTLIVPLRPTMMDETFVGKVKLTVDPETHAPKAVLKNVPLMFPLVVLELNFGENVADGEVPPPPDTVIVWAVTPYGTDKFDVAENTGTLEEFIPNGLAPVPNPTNAAEAVKAEPDESFTPFTMTDPVAYMTTLLLAPEPEPITTFDETKRNTPDMPPE